MFVCASKAFRVKRHSLRCCPHWLRAATLDEWFESSRVRLTRVKTMAFAKQLALMTSFASANSATQVSSLTSHKSMFVQVISIRCFYFRKALRENRQMFAQRQHLLKWWHVCNARKQGGMRVSSKLRAAFLPKAASQEHILRWECMQKWWRLHSYWHGQVDWHEMCLQIRLYGTVLRNE